MYEHGCRPWERPSISVTATSFASRSQKNTRSTARSSAMPALSRTDPRPAMTWADPDELARAAATDFARDLILCWQGILRTELLGVYLIGSLAHGGFSRRYSDVDLALVTTTGLSSQTLDNMRNEAITLSDDWGPKVSVFWADRHFSGGRFPPLDRIDYLDHAVALLE